MSEQTVAAVPDTGGLIDLNAGRAARREGKNKDVRVTIGDTTIALPVEFPLDALSPLRDINLDFGMVVGAANPEQVLRDLVTAKPQLVTEAIEAGKAVLEGLFCSCGAYQENLMLPGGSHTTFAVEERVEHADECSWLGFVRERPSTQDLIALARGLATAYGLSLGEALESSTSAGSGGTTSRPTSSATTSSTRAARGTGRTAKGRRAPVKAVASASDA